MSDKDLKEQEEKSETGETLNETQPDGDDGGKKNLVCFYVAIGCFVLGCILFALSFVIRGAGVYMLIASMISELAAVSFLNGQKKYGVNTACKVIRILSYVVMAAAIIVVVIGMSVTATAK